MKSEAKQKHYERACSQLEELFGKTEDLFARIATISALLHQKMNYFFWTGFYRLVDGELTVSSYQGSLACLVLKKNMGVCWASINRKETIIVEDVENFDGHIACDSRSKSEIVVPIKNPNGEIIGVFDVDSKELASFDEIDKFWLEKILGKLFNK